MSKCVYFSAMVMKKIPNILTFLRIAIIPMLMVVLPVQKPWSDLVCFYVFIFGALTDGLDGYLARKYDAVTKLGQLIDPIADKMYVSSALVMLVFINRIHPWVVIILLTREFAISGLRSVALQDKIEIPVGQWGKWKSAVQMIGIAGLIQWSSYRGFNFRFWGSCFVYLSVFLSIFSAVQYFQRYFKLSRHG